MKSKDFFAPFRGCFKNQAFHSENTNGRRFSRSDDDVYNGSVDPFLLDANKIRDSKAYRRLKDKAQVFSLPENPHVRTRLVHTEEVVSFSTKAASILGLNVFLCEAIASGHDIGHAPYGHIGEQFLAKMTGKNFRHEIMSVVIAQKIERQGTGLNLSQETLFGILNHSCGKNKINIDPKLPHEFSIVMLSDKIVYTLSDLNDAMLRYGYIRQEELPKEVAEFGSHQRERELTCMKALIQESVEEGKISFSKSDTARKFEIIRQWMFENVYLRVDWSVHEGVLKKIYEFFSEEFGCRGCDPAIILALLTDKEANAFAKIFLSTQRPKFKSISNFGVVEVLPYINNKNIDFTDPDMDW